MGRLASVKLQREEEEKNPPKATQPTTYPGFAATGIDKATWESQKAEEDAKVDKRSGLSKLWDTVNIGDSGRSWTTKDPTENKSVKDSVGDVATGLFSGTEKTLDAVQALTGATERKQAKRDEKYNKDIQALNDQIDKDPKNKDLQNKKKKVREEYQKQLESDLKDTEWAGDEDKGFGDRLKKAAGVSAETVSEFIPVGKGAQAGKLAEKAAVTGAKEVAEKGAKEVVEKGATAGLSRMAKAKLAAEVGAQQAVVGAVGGAGGAASEDNANLNDIAREGLTGLATGATLGATGTLLPSVLPKRGVSEVADVERKAGTVAAEAAPQASIVENIPERNELDVPAFMRRTTPEGNQGEAAKLQKVNNPAKDAYKAAQSEARGATNARAQVARLGEDPADTNNIPAFQRKGVDEKINSINSDIDNIDAQLSALPEDVNLPQYKFKARQELAEQIKQNPSKKQQLIDLYNRRMNTVENSTSLSDLKDNLAAKRQSLQDELQYNLSVKDAVDTTPKPSADEITPTVAPVERAKQALAAVDDSGTTSIEAPITIERSGGTGGSSSVSNSARANVAAPEEVAPPTTKSLNEKAPIRDRDVVMNADVDGGSSVMVAPIKMRVLGELEDEADLRAPSAKGGAGEGSIRGASQATETKTQKGAQYIVDDIDALQKQTGIDVEPLDRKVAAKLTGETTRSNFQEFKDKMGRNFQDTLTYGARTLGKTGSDFVYDMLQGNKFKRDALDALRDNMGDLAKLNKKLAGSSLSAKRDLGARLGSALDDRANADQFLKSPQEKELFDKYVAVFDYVKQLREKSGLEVLDNYRPWVDMKNAAEPPMWLAENVTNKRTQTLSRFSKERTKTEAGDSVDNNLADMIYGYVNSQLNEMAYDAPVRRLKDGIDNLGAGNRANVGAMNEGIDYMRELVQQAVNPARKNPLERVAGKLTSNVYGSVLPFNLRLAVQNKTQKFVANSRVSKGARSMVGKISADDAKELEKGLVFGDTTVYGQLEDVNATPTGKGKSLIEKAKNIDPYQKSEHNNVISSYHKGAMQAVKDSEPYKAAKANGMKTQDAIHTALQDPEVKEAAIRRGNVVVNDTQFGASPLARPEMLREEGSLWGVLPKKTIYMFTRFPIGMSQHTLEVLDGKNTRALEMLKNGDPRSVSIAEMRTNYHALLDSMKDAQKAIKGGTDIGIPQDVLNKQIETVSKNLKTIDAKAKDVSQIRAGKTVANLGKMWAAAAAIQIIFDGGIQSFADDPGGTTAEALGKTNPTMSNRVVGEYSPLAAITSSASPLDRYGNINERAISNYIPGVGLAVNRGRDVQKIVQSLTGSGEEEK